MKKLFFYSLLFSVSIFADEELVDCDSDINVISVLPKVERIEKKACLEERKKTPVSGAILTDEDAGWDRCDLREILILGIYVPNLDQLQQQLKSCIGRRINPDNLIRIRNAITRHFCENNRPFVVVVNPPQDFTDGIVKFYVMEAKVGRVFVKGNRWFPSRMIEKTIRVYPGDFLNPDKVRNNIAWLNRNPFPQAELILTPEENRRNLAWIDRNPFHQTELILSSGEKRYTTDVEITTKDRLPLRPYIGTNNIGTKLSGENRWFVGANCNMLTGLNDYLTYQFTSSYHIRKIQSHYGNYTILLPWKDQLTLYSGYTRIKPKGLTGRNYQASGRYILPIKPLYGPLSREVTIGVDFKNTDNNFLFVSEEFPILVRDVNIFQIYLRAQMERIYDTHDFYLFVENYFSPGNWLQKQSKSRYNALRPGAKSFYDYVKLTFVDRMLWNSLETYFVFRGQAASRSLLPSEQFGLGGYNTVRGYVERAFNADNALCGNFELRIPIVKTRRIKTTNEVSLVGFVDYGWGRNYETSPGIHKSEWLLGVGPGVRVVFFPHFVGRLDYGFNLHHIDFVENKRGRIHFSVIASF
ncbi:MAG: BamA/TamA family outer membrane protein [Chlamydiae bacterium]|nr:BamA/TamA family outer membrane protein [Chlamydiota bacterium]